MTYSVVELKLYNVEMFSHCFQADLYCIIWM